MELSCFFDVARNGTAVELEVTADVSGPEHDVGIMGPVVENIRAICLEDEPTFDDLTESETQQVIEKLSKIYYYHVDKRD